MADLFDQVLHKHERVTIDRRGKKVALVPMEDLERLEAMDNQRDIADADKALTESAERIDYEQLRKEMGL